MEIIDKLKENKERIVKITLSGTNLEIKKINIRPIVIKSKNMFQVERFVGNKVFHENISFDDVLKLDFGDYRQILIQTLGNTFQFIKNKTGYKCKVTTNELNELKTDHDNVKHYLFQAIYPSCET